MKNLPIIILIITSFTACSQNKTMKYNKLTLEEENIIVNKGTEAPNSGIYNDFSENGTFLCKRCDAPLYKSNSKFDSHCGWPSFDDEIDGAIKRITDKDGQRTEILCANCEAHLGHVFLGEGYTQKDTRHCVNSISLNFEPLEINKTQKAIFAGGCFWGVEYYFQSKKGVISVESGYIGGKIENPTYEQVCSGKSGYIEAVEVVYNSNEISYEELAKLFFEIHDPTQINRQGPDVGEQYSSAIFYFDEEQKQISKNLIAKLEDDGLKVVTKLIKTSKFWKAEKYHQNYYENNGNRPYCHFYTKRF